MLVHSYLYYHLDTEIISDDQWQKWAEELTELHKMNNHAKIGMYDEAFEDWDGTTGMHLPKDGWVSGQAYRLLGYKEKYE